MNLLDFLFLLIFSCLLSSLITLPVRKLAIKIGLVDHPNSRKLNLEPVPLVGGIILFITTCSSVMLFNISTLKSEMMVLLSASYIMFIVGILDDKVDIRAIFKLAIEICLGYFMVKAGLRIENLHGYLGIYEISIFWQYIITIGTFILAVNAYNLIDGIDGLAMGMGILSLSILSVVACSLKNWDVMVLFISLLGSLIALLRYNLAKENKIFLGDGGSLFLGTIIITGSIQLANTIPPNSLYSFNINILFGMLALPMLDAVRVFISRVSKGKNPFSADKTHFHHCLIALGLEHKTATTIIIFIAFLMIFLSALFGHLLEFTLMGLFIQILFISFSYILNLLNSMFKWQKEMKLLE